ncbi:MAG: Mn transporter [Solirubrobacterales bacterium]|nr:Mn transporter [Solirubrobacterales bacterium]
MLGPGLLAGLSDDDPAGITTYSVLGQRYGFQLLWVLTVSTAALIVFHELGARLGVVTGKGLFALVRERYGHRTATAGVAALLVANIGTLCAELAGVAAGGQLLGGVPKGVSVPVAVAVIVLLVTAGSFHRVEHVLLALSAVFATYVVSGLLAHPDWGAAARGMVVPTMPITRDAVLIAVATLGTTLAPWGLTFIQSYAVDKHLTPADLRYERIDVISGAVLTGVIGLFIAVSCAATLHRQGIAINDAADAARGLQPLAGGLAATLFGLGFVGAALLAAAVVPLSTAYSVCEAAGQPGDVNARLRQAPLFYGTFAGSLVLAGAIVLVPGMPLLLILVGTQALNAVLLLAVLPFLMALGRDPAVMGEHAAGRAGRWAMSTTYALIALSIALLLVLQLQH